MILVDVLEGSEMSCVHKQVAHGQWVDHCCLKTEFDAYVSAMTKSTETMGTYRVYDSTFQEVTMAFEMGMEIDVGGKELQRDHEGCCPSSHCGRADQSPWLRREPQMGVSSCAVQELIGKRETSWTPSPVFEAKATLGEFSSLLGFSF